MMNTDTLENYQFNNTEMTERLINLLALVEGVESFFLDQKEILQIRDCLKEKQIDLKKAPAYIYNLRKAFSRANAKLVSLIKMSSKDPKKYMIQTEGNSNRTHINIYSNMFNVNYSRTSNVKDILNNNNNKGTDSKTNNSPTNDCSMRGNYSNKWDKEDRNKFIKVLFN